MNFNELYYCNSLFQFAKRPSREVCIGETPLGGTNPIRIQSMTNTDTMNVEDTVCQAIKMIEAGCEYVRITTPTMKSVESLALIKQKLRQNGFKTPIIADVHFNAVVALEAARVAEKIRINPGNYTDKNIGKIHFSESEYSQAIERIHEKITPLIKVCKQYGTALRIGSNQGSLSERIISRYGDTPEGMVEAAMEFVRICNDLDFHNLVLSMKSSNTRTMVFASRLLVHKMLQEGFNYPLHLGVTEAGAGEDGRIKSAVGIGTLLMDGIGDTIRVSLTESPEKELAPAQKLVNRFNRLISLRPCGKKEPFKNPFTYGRMPSKQFENIGEPLPPIVISTNPHPQADYVANDPRLAENTCIISCADNQTIHSERNALCHLLQQNNEQPKIFHKIYRGSDKETLQLQAAADFGALLIDGLCDGVFLETPDIPDPNFPIDLSFAILQAARSRISYVELISCPSCGRTQFDIIGAVAEIREKTRHLKGITIAVMGCIVNGPGEMAGAD
ncbi:MAG: (E)-4-hydroxy-3-methylbut-2-enyl-diphosphate synthase, partial [Bacteroidales bacterium]|nr:(E)-4-hydroxy-3-methylbut-2-enyl-diphosphate synthase [Bacteroidales bacterium]